MDSAVSKLFGREFIIGFFLPAVFFVVASASLLKFLGIEMALLEIDWKKPIESTAFLILVTWVLAVFLQALNREIFRFAEGYWPLWIRKRLCGRQRKRFSRMHQRLEQLKSGKDDAKLGIFWSEMIVTFPSKESLLLPTSFGNAVRAYEEYPRVMYGFESINGWPRLQAVIAKEFREILNANRSRVDLWLNISFLAFIFVVETLALARSFGQPKILWLVPALLVIIVFGSARSRGSAIQYGEQVKAAFDVYLPELAAKLGYVLSDDVQKNERFWKSFSQVMVYRHRESLKKMAAAGLERVSTLHAEKPAADFEP